jgi:hypothetical protein
MVTRDRTATVIGKSQREKQFSRRFTYPHEQSDARRRAQQYTCRGIAVTCKKSVGRVGPSSFALRLALSWAKFLMDRVICFDRRGMLRLKRVSG